MSNKARSSRIYCRFSPDEKALIERAAAHNGTSTTDFVRSTFLAAAKDAIRTHEVIRLTTEGSYVFVEALLNPPEPKANLRALHRQFGSVVGR